MRGGRDALAYLWIALATVVFHAVTARGYGIFRDELYYLACADHLAWGYVDHPPLSVAVLAIARALFGDSLFAIRVVPALAAGVTVMFAASIARAFGGAAFAQRLAAIGTAVAPLIIGLCGFYSMNALDLVIWAGALRLLVAILSGANPQLWVAFGAIAGLGLENKISVLFLGVGVVAGLIAARQWQQLKSHWLWLGGAIAIVIALPNVLWQIAHDWPTLEFMENARRYKMEGTNVLGFIGATILNGGPLALPLWGGGLWWLLARPEAQRFRAVGWAVVTILVVMIGSGSKPYYFGPAFPVAFAAGGAAWERWSELRGRRTLRIIMVVVVLLGAAITAPLAKPLLPVEAFIRYARALGISVSSGERHEIGRLPQHYADMHGWKDLAVTVAGVRDALPPDDRDRVCIAAQNYGEAGAIDYFGPALGLPRAVSGHNSYWHWGPRDCADKVWIVIGDRGDVLETIFESVERGGTFECDLCMPFENHNPVWICRRLKGDVKDMWLRAKHFI